MGIDLYWATDEYSWGNEPVDLLGFGHLSDVYRFDGRLVFDSKGDNVGTYLGNEQMQVFADERFSQNKYDYKIERQRLLKKYFSGQSVYAFLKNARHANLGVFVKLVILDRRGIVTCPTPQSVFGNIDFNNAGTRSPQEDIKYEGAFIFALGMAEEKPFVSTGSHYVPEDYLELLNWSTAHEIAHLVTLHSAPSQDLDSDGHINQSAALLTNGRPSDGLSGRCSHLKEIRAVNLLTRLSVCPSN